VHNLIHWGEQFNWRPIVCLGIAAVAVFGMRLLTVWFFTRRLITTVKSTSDTEMEKMLAECLSTERPVVPLFVSYLYFFFGVVFLAVIVWGLISTAWWMLVLGYLLWAIVHIPFRDTMNSLAMVQRVSTAANDSDALLKGGLTADQEKEIKKRLGI